MAKEIDTTGDQRKQSGQSIVLLTFMMIGLLAFVGIAVDVGVVFARRAQLSKAVDAAALAAVTEVLDVTELGPANTKAGQFLSSNLPLTATMTGVAPPLKAVTFSSGARTTPLGAIQYSITATWPVDLYFLKVIGRDVVDITQAATAAYFFVTDIYASRRVEDGALSTSNQAVFGPNICSDYGDPFSPLNPTWPGNDDLYDGLYTYKYRILIPGDYEERASSNIVRVELFDPDSINRLNNNGGSYTAQVLHTDVWIDSGRPNPQTLSCTRNNMDPCLIDTGEDEALGLELDQVNPWWFVRIDENRGTGGAPGNGTCGNPGTYNTAYNTQTEYTLAYFAQGADGSIQEIPLSRYLGQTGDGVRDNGDHDTDMRWVSPGGAQSSDQPVFVPADFGSFEVDLTSDVPNILTDPATGNRYLYLGVRTLSGASENGFEIWAGPPDYITTIASNVNLRNIQIINEPGSHSSQGATVFGMGNLPLNSNFDFRVDIPLIYVPAEYAGQRVFISLFDTDSGAVPPVTFSFDSVASEDWSISFGSGGTDPDGISGRCVPGGCNNQWVDPPYEITIPTLDTAACAADPGNQEVCTPFFGGRLVASYDSGFSDSYGWQIRLEGLPYLVR